MTSPRGRRASPIRTPALIRDYLAGRDGPDGPWPGDTDAEKALRPAQGDYTTRIHQRVKAYIRLNARSGRRHQWPRSHSFYSMVNLLLRLGLLEKTGVQAEPEGRGAGRGGTAAGFTPRTWVRLTAGSLSDPRWDDPMGQVAPRGRPAVGPGPVPAPPAPEPVVRRRRAIGQNGHQEPRRPRTRAAAPAPGLAGEVNRQRQDLWARATEIGEQGATLEEYQELYGAVVALAAQVQQAFPREEARRLTEGLELLENCLALAQEENLTPRQRGARMRNCEAAARVLAEGLRGEFG